MSKCDRCRQRDADSGKFATPDWENRCDWCVHLVAGNTEYLRREYPGKFEDGEVVHHV